MYKLALTLCLATVALAEPWGHGYHGYYGHGHVAYGLPGLSQHHAGGGHSYQSGSHLGKRSANPHGYYYGHHGFHGYHGHAHALGSATLADGELAVTHPGGGTSSVSGHSLGKRSANPHGYYYGHHGYHGHHGLHHVHPAAVGLDTTLTVEHPGGGSSTVSGHSLGKRSAQPWGYGHHGFYGHHGYHGHHGAHVAAVHGTGVAGHPGGATSYVHTSGIGKRSADAEPTVWGAQNGHGGFVGQHSNGAGAHIFGALDNYHHGYGYGHWVGKRSADAEPIVWGAQNGHGGFVGQLGNGAGAVHGHGHYGYLGYHGGYGHHFGKRSADAEPIVWGANNGHGGWVGQAIPAHGHGHGYLHGYHGYHHG